MPFTYECTKCNKIVAVLTKNVYSIKFIQKLHTEIDECNKDKEPFVWNDETIEKLFFKSDVNAKYRFWNKYKKLR